MRKRNCQVQLEGLERRDVPATITLVLADLPPLFVPPVQLPPNAPQPVEPLPVPAPAPPPVPPGFFERLWQRVDNFFNPPPPPFVITPEIQAKIDKIVATDAVKLADSILKTNDPLATAARMNIPVEGGETYITFEFGSGVKVSGVLTEDGKLIGDWAVTLPDGRLYDIATGDSFWPKDYSVKPVQPDPAWTQDPIGFVPDGTNPAVMIPIFPVPPTPDTPPGTVLTPGPDPSLFPPGTLPPPPVIPTPPGTPINPPPTDPATPPDTPPSPPTDSQPPTPVNPPPTDTTPPSNASTYPTTYPVGSVISPSGWIFSPVGTYNPTPGFTNTFELVDPTTLTQDQMASSEYALALNGVGSDTTQGFYTLPLVNPVDPYYSTNYTFTQYLALFNTVPPADYTVANPISTTG